MRAAIAACGMERDAVQLVCCLPQDAGVITRHELVRHITCESMDGQGTGGCAHAVGTPVAQSSAASRSDASSRATRPSISCRAASSSAARMPRCSSPRQTSSFSRRRTCARRCEELALAKCWRSKADRQSPIARRLAPPAVKPTVRTASVSSASSCTAPSTRPFSTRWHRVSAACGVDPRSLLRRVDAPTRKPLPSTAAP